MFSEDFCSLGEDNGFVYWINSKEVTYKKIYKYEQIILIMKILKSIKQLVEDVNTGDLIMFKLEASKNANDTQKENTVAVGYLWDDYRLYHISGKGNLERESSRKAYEHGINISNGTFFGSKILEYEIIIRNKS